MRYRVILPRAVQKELDRLPDDVVRRILTRLSQLGTNPRPPDVKKLKGREAWRIRVGDYRVIYKSMTATCKSLLSRRATVGKFTGEGRLNRAVNRVPYRTTAE